MTKAVLFSAENIQKAKAAIYPLARAFLQLEPGNTLVLPETQQGNALIEQAFSKLEAMGYSPEDAQLLVSEVAEKISGGSTDTYEPPADAVNTLRVTKKNDEF